jgi:TolB-like protein
LRKDVFAPQVAAHKGRVVKLMGDGALVEFPSIVNAVNCAIAVQRTLADRATDEAIRLRIGINLGDIIIEGSDIYGDGVNVAARIEEVAEPGGITLSGPAFDQVSGKVEATFTDAGEHDFKNIAKPVRIYHWSDDAGSQGDVADTETSLPLPDKPSIAVLQRYFSDGITEDIITELSRFSSLQVVARNSTFVYRDQAVDVGEVGKKLGVEYLLEGGLRKAGNRIRLTAQLINVQTGMHVWANRYDRDLEDIFAIQDELVHAIVSTLAVRLTAADTERTMRKPAENHAAYDLYLRAVALDSQYDAESALESRKLAEQAVALDPGFARAHAVLAAQIFTYAWFTGIDIDTYMKDALPAAQKAVALDPEDSFCTSILGVVHLQRRDYEQARHYMEMALTSNPHDSWVWADYAWYLLSIGKRQEALDRLDAKEIFEPYPPNWHWEIRGQVLYMLERFEEAVAAFDRMSITPFWVNGLLTACYGQLGDVENAQIHWARSMAEAPIENSNFAIELAVYKNEADANRWFEGVRKAGIEA